MEKNMILKRVFISIVVGILFGFVLSEVGFYLFGRTARKPTNITIVIPNGTAKLVAQGEQPPTLPKNMIFVVGDTLVVKNEDSVNHQLGPLWIPAGTEARLQLGTVENLAFQCSFQPTNYLALDVREPLTMGTRVTGILFAGIPFGLLIAVYAVILPGRKKEA